MSSGRTSTSCIQRFLESGFIPSAAYILGVANNDAHMLSERRTQIPYFSNNPTSYSFSENVNTGINIGWNEVDGLAVFLLGLYQFYYNKGPNDKVKGGFNILNGLQLFIFTYNPLLTPNNLKAAGPTALASPAFALAMFLDFINAFIDTIQARREFNEEKNKIESEKQGEQVEAMAKRHKLEQEYNAKFNLCFIKGLSCFGMVLVAVPTLMKWNGATTSSMIATTMLTNPVGLVVTSGVALHYTYKGIQWFFSPKKPLSTQEKLQASPRLSPQSTL